MIDGECKRRARKAIAALAAVFSLAATPAAPNDPTITFIDSGAGDCILLQCPAPKAAKGPTVPGEHILVDCGTNGKYLRKGTGASGEFESVVATPFASAIIRYLEGETQSKFRAALITHGDKDHSNILNAWLQAADRADPAGASASTPIQVNGNLEIGELLLGGVTEDYPSEVAGAATPFITYAMDAKNKRGPSLPGTSKAAARAPSPGRIKNVELVRDAERGVKIGEESKKLKCGAGDMRFYPLFIGDIEPGKGVAGDPNIRSAVYVATYVQAAAAKQKERRTHVVLTGDALNETVEKILKNSASVRALLHDKNADNYVVLKARHHGSDKQIFPSKEWLDMIRPDAVIFTSGGKFGHPRCETVQQMAKYFGDNEKLASGDASFELGKSVYCFSRDSSESGPIDRKKAFGAFKRSAPNGEYHTTYRPGSDQIRTVMFNFANRNWAHGLIPPQTDFLAKTGLLHVCARRPMGEPAESVRTNPTRLEARKMNEKKDELIARADEIKKNIDKAAKRERLKRSREFARRAALLAQAAAISAELEPMAVDHKNQVRETPNDETLRFITDVEAALAAGKAELAALAKEDDAGSGDRKRKVSEIKAVIDGLAEDSRTLKRCRFAKIEDRTAQMDGK